MSTLNRYISSIFIQYLLVILLVLLSLYGLIEFIEKVDDFIEHTASLETYLLYPIYKLPLMLSHSLPMAILLSSFATIGSLSRTGQLTALLGGGISVSQVSRPLFFCGIVLCGLVLIGNIWVVPWSNSEAEYLLQTKIKGKQAQNVQDKELFFRDGNKIISIDYSFPQKQEVQGISIIELDDQFRPIERREADRATHHLDGVWLFEGLSIWEFSPEDQQIKSFTRHDQLQIDLGRQPEEMVQLWHHPEEMSLPQLNNFIEKLANEGHDPRNYTVEAQLRLARSFTPLIMILLGIPFSLQRGRQSSISLGVAISLGIFIVYFLLYAIFAALGSSAILPPLVAAWAANVLMGLAGAWMFLHTQS
jgi:lipopolysaccharide export system permease protein